MNKKVVIGFLFLVLFLVFTPFIINGAIVDSTQLNLLAVVQGTAEIKISDTSASTPEGFNGATEVDSWEFTAGDLESDSLYLLVKTNKKEAFSINVKIKNMISTKVSTYIIYDIKSSGTAIVTSKSVKATSLLFSIPPASTTSGMRVLSFEFTIALKSDTSATEVGTYEYAIASTYTAAITFELATP